MIYISHPLNGIFNSFQLCQIKDSHLFMVRDEMNITLVDIDEMKSHSYKEGIKSQGLFNEMSVDYNEKSHQVEILAIVWDTSNFFFTDRTKLTKFAVK